VRAEQDGGARVAQLADEVDEELLVDGVEPGERLVEDGKGGRDAMNWTFCWLPLLRASSFSSARSARSRRASQRRAASRAWRRVMPRSTPK
jgi:hypothetical protein